MTNLNRQAFGGLLRLFISVAVSLFLPAWSLHYTEAWIFLAVFFASVFLITVYLMKKDPKLLERRVHAGPSAEKETSQKIIQSITALGFMAMLVLPALDHRFHWWPAVPFFASVAGGVLVAIGFLIIFFVYKENTFASATIEVYPDQRVVSSGLYALVRHPMYMGGIVFFVGAALSLGSWWGLLAFLLMMPAFIWRIFEEERLLSKNLPGYAEYKNKVMHRLVPFIW